MEIQNNKRVHAYLSKTIAGVMSQELLDAENRFTFAIYLHLTALKCCFADAVKAKNEIYTLLNTPQYDEQLYKNDVDILYAGNGKLLVEIYNDVWSGSAAAGMEWVASWEQTCHDHSLKNNTPLQNWMEFAKVVNRHLEVPANRFAITLFLIQKTLQKA